MPIGYSDEGIFLNWDSIFLDDCTLCQAKKSISTLFPIQAQRLCVDSGHVMVENLITIKFVSHILPTMHMFLGKLEIIFYNKVEMGGFKKLLSSPLPSPPLPSPLISSPPLSFSFGVEHFELYVMKFCPFFWLRLRNFDWFLLCVTLSLQLGIGEFQMFSFYHLNLEVWTSTLNKF